MLLPRSAAATEHHDWNHPMLSTLITFLMAHVGAYLTKHTVELSIYCGMAVVAVGCSVGLWYLVPASAKVLAVLLALDDAAIALAFRSAGVDVFKVVEADEPTK